jgi:hypothetical protein
VYGEGVDWGVEEGAATIRRLGQQKGEGMVGSRRAMEVAQGVESDKGWRWGGMTRRLGAGPAQGSEN